VIAMHRENGHKLTHSCAELSQLRIAAGCASSEVSGKAGKMAHSNLHIALGFGDGLPKCRDSAISADVLRR
jgi:hypothetical protein